MIIYGRRATHVGSSLPPTLTCKNCNSTGTVSLSAFTNYAHIFWVPLFPFGKTIVTQCHHCNKVFTDKEIPAEYKSYEKDLKGITKAPKWTFVGLAIIGVLIAIGTYNSSKKAEENKTFIAAPRMGDVYKVKTEENNYTLYKVTDVVGDTVSIVFNKYEINKGSQMYKINKPENFGTDTVMILRSSLVEMFEKNEIMDITRD